MKVIYYDVLAFSHQITNNAGAYKTRAAGNQVTHILSPFVFFTTMHLVENDDGFINHLASTKHTQQLQSFPLPDQRLHSYRSGRSFMLSRLLFVVRDPVVIVHRVASESVYLP
jgi:hypothetical protein